MAGLWSIVVPQAGTNLITNPSIETGTTKYAASGAGTTVSRVTTNSCFGYSSLYVVPGDVAGAGVTIHATTRIAVTAGTSYTLSLWAKGVGADYLGTLQILWYNAASGGVLKGTDSENNTFKSDYWAVYDLTATAPTGATHAEFKISRNQTGTAGYVIDGVQFEAKGYRTTYMDGDQEGCEWSGTAHASTSSRSAQSLAGGRIYNLDSYTAYVTSHSGTGMPPLSHNIQPYALLPGAMYQNTKIHARPMVLNMVLKGSSLSNLHALRQSLLSALKIDQVATPQPVLLRYTGAAAGRTIEIPVLYESGLEAGGFDGFSEHLALRFLAVEPFWRRSELERAQVLDWADSATHSYIAGRIDGAWSALGPTSSGDTVRGVTIGKDGYVYITGNFTNWNGTAAADYVAYWNGSAWAAMGSGLDDVGGAITVGPDGYVYVGGQFVTANGVTCRGIARWTGSTFAAIGPPNPGSGGFDVWSVVFDQNGDMWVGGAFTNWNGIANDDYVVYYDTSASTWVAPAVAPDASVYGLAVGPNNYVYAVGTFTNIGGVAGNGVAYWDGTSWNAMGTGLGGAGTTGYAVAVGPDGTVYVGGNFTTAGGVSCSLIAQWNGSVWAPLGSGMVATNYVRTLAVGPDGMLYAGGPVSPASDPSYLWLARWNGSAWAPMDIDDLGGGAATNPRCFCFTKQDPVVKRNYDLYVGFETSGTSYYAGSTTVTNNGSETAYPRIYVSASLGGATLRSIRNQTTGKELLFNYPLLAGEQLVIDLREGRKTITSSFFGNALRAIFPGSDFATFGLQPGANTITCFIDTGGLSIATAYMLWKERWWSLDVASSQGSTPV